MSEFFFSFFIGSTMNMMSEFYFSFYVEPISQEFHTSRAYRVTIFEAIIGGWCYSEMMAV
jgi:hypothetical protein